MVTELVVQSIPHIVVSAWVMTLVCLHVSQDYSNCMRCVLSAHKYIVWATGTCLHARKDCQLKLGLDIGPLCIACQCQMSCALLVSRFCDCVINCVQAEDFKSARCSTKTELETWHGSGCLGIFMNSTCSIHCEWKVATWFETRYIRTLLVKTDKDWSISIQWVF